MSDVFIFHGKRAKDLRTGVIATRLRRIERWKILHWKKKEFKYKFGNSEKGFKWMKDFRYFTAIKEGFQIGNNGQREKLSKGDEWCCYLSRKKSEGFEHGGDWYKVKENRKMKNFALKKEGI